MERDVIHVAEIDRQPVGTERPKRFVLLLTLPAGATHHHQWPVKIPLLPACAKSLKHPEQIFTRLYGADTQEK